MTSLVMRVASLTDYLEDLWEQVVMKRVAGSFLVIVYLGMIGAIELNRRGLMLPGLAEWLPESHFFAVEFTFTLLLITEVVSLIFGLSRSFSRSVGIQLEILSLILLRDTFKVFTEFSEPLQWEAVRGSLSTMVADAAGALAIFVIIGIYYSVQTSRSITKDEKDQEMFIAYKKLIALGLIVTFTIIGIDDLLRSITGRETFPFFDSFYTILIFTDVLMVLLSMRFSISYAVTFRNFGYAIVTIFIRLALVAPTIIGVGIGIGTALFALGMAVAYNRFGGIILHEAEVDHAESHGRAAQPATSSSDSSVYGPQPQSGD
ncbi:MAG: hypothetical protein AAFU54_20705 [Chloroflexota bacterium]